MVKDSCSQAEVVRPQNLHNEREEETNSYGLSPDIYMCAYIMSNLDNPRYGPEWVHKAVGGICLFGFTDNCQQVTQVGYFLYE